MDLKQDEISVFIELYKKEYGITLNAEKATEELAKLRQLYQLVYLTPIDSKTKAAIYPTNPMWYNSPATHKIIN